MKRTARTWATAAARDAGNALATGIGEAVAWIVQVPLDRALTWADDHVRDRGAMTSRRLGGDDEVELLRGAVDPGVTPVCHFCGRNGATATAGVGQVAGVAVHVDCWLENAGDGRE